MKELLLRVKRAKNELELLHKQFSHMRSSYYGMMVTEKGMDYRVACGLLVEHLLTSGITIYVCKDSEDYIALFIDENDAGEWCKIHQATMTTQILLFN